MKLQLKYDAQQKHATAAAFIKGGNPALWLAEIGRWNMAITALDCYVVPASIRSVDAAGLLVYFKTSPVPVLEAAEPYAIIAGKLFIPVNATLFPQVTDQELGKLLLWPYQVWHPVIGLVAFEEKDKLNFKTQLHVAPEMDADWSFAHPGNTSRPPLHQVIVKQPTVEELMAEMTEAVQPKLLDEIPGKKNALEKALEKTVDQIKWFFFKIALSGVHLLSGGKQKESGTKTNPGNLQRLQQWLTENITEIEKKREEELHRLMKLFEENSDEALQYAIPLNSAYLNRGEASKSTTLGKRSTSFNLANIGGGGLVDSWDIGSYYGDLRSKYLAAAQNAIDRKDYKKAAYVYAHLLGDFGNAANVLEQGKYYREAAVLYKDHLKNDTAAAECLERGELYLEAIDLYSKQQQTHTEKIGDLYAILQQHENAGNYYQQAVDIKTTNHDFLDASRIMLDKMNKTEDAKDLLLSGWKKNNQSGNCLRKYFELVQQTDHESTPQKVTDVYTHHTSTLKQTLFLDVLQDVYRYNKQESAASVYREIAYEIVSHESGKGNLSIVHHINRFFEEDRLISADCSRYISNTNRFQVERSGNIIQLDKSIRWHKAIHYRNQFLAVGTANNVLHMVRGNWYGNLEYYSWTNNIMPHTRFNFIYSPWYSSNILLHSSDGVPVTRQNLEKHKYFNHALTVYCPAWLHKENSQFIMTAQNELCRIEINNNIITLHYYTIEGELKRSLSCHFENEVPQIASGKVNPLIVAYEDHYYTCRDKVFFSVSEKGIAKATSFESGIRFFAAAEDVTKPTIVISTNSGCILCKPGNGELMIRGEIFAPHLTPSQIVFITSERFLVVEKLKAVLFFIIDDQPVTQREYTSVQPIVSALPASRNQFALIDQAGTIIIYTIE